MADPTGPSTYLEKLRFAQRVIRGAQYRHDQKQAIRELCEAARELVAALLEREEGQQKTAEAEAPPPEEKRTP